MVSMAILAQRGVFIAGLHPLPVRADPERGDGAVIVLVTFAAVDPFEAGRMWPLLDAVEILVTADTLQIGMDASGEALGIDVERYIVAVPFDFQAGAGMTLKTV